MAITVTDRGQLFSTSNVSSFGTPAFLPAANSLIVAMVFADGTTSVGSMTGANGPVWRREVRQTYNSDGDTAFIFTAPAGTSPSSFIPVFQCSDDNATGACLQVWEIGGQEIYDYAVRQTAVLSTAAANPTLTFANAINTNNAVIVGFGVPRNPAAGTPPSGWTESVDSGHATPTAGACFAFKATGVATTTIVYSAASGNIGCIGIEIWASSAIPPNVYDTNMMGMVGL